MPKESSVSDSLSVAPSSVTVSGFLSGLVMTKERDTLSMPTDSLSGTTLARSLALVENEYVSIVSPFQSKNSMVCWEFSSSPSSEKEMTPSLSAKEVSFPSSFAVISFPSGFVTLNSISASVSVQDKLFSDIRTGVLAVVFTLPEQSSFPDESVTAKEYSVPGSSPSADITALPFSSAVSGTSDPLRLALRFAISMFRALSLMTAELNVAS